MHLPKTNLKKTFAEKSRKDSSSEKRSDNFFIKKHEPQNKAIAMLPSNATLSQLFCEIQHRHIFQCSSGTPDFIMERCAEAKTIWTRQSMVDI